MRRQVQILCFVLNVYDVEPAGPGSSKDSPLYLMDYESTCPLSPDHMHSSSGQRDHMAATLEEQLLSYSENTENEGEEEEYLEEKMLQVQSWEELCEHTHDTHKYRTHVC